MLPSGVSLQRGPKNFLSVERNLTLSLPSLAASVILTSNSRHWRTDRDFTFCKMPTTWRHLRENRREWAVGYARCVFVNRRVFVSRCVFLSRRVFESGCVFESRSLFQHSQNLPVRFNLLQNAVELDVPLLPEVKLGQRTDIVAFSSHLLAFRQHLFRGWTFTAYFKRKGCWLISLRKKSNEPKSGVFVRQQAQQAQHQQ